MNNSSTPAKSALPTTPEHFSVGHWLRHYRARAFQLYVLVAIVAFAVLVVFASTTPYFGFDLTFEHYVQSLQSAPMDILMQLISDPGFAPQSLSYRGHHHFISIYHGLALGGAFISRCRGGRQPAGGSDKTLYSARARPTPELVHVLRP